MKNDLNIKWTVDRLGEVNARIAELRVDADDHKAVLIELAAEGPVRSFEGDKYKATVSFVDRTVVDHKRLVELLEKAGVDHDLIAKALKKASKVVTGLPVVRVSDR